MSEAASLQSLLRRPVLLRGIRLGQPTDAVIDLAAMRVVGLEIRCGDESDRFLPFPAADVREGAIHVDSALQLLDDGDLSFYRRRTSSFGSLQGLPVERGGRLLGALLDVVVRADGSALELAVAGDGGSARVSLDEAVSIGGRPVASAA